MYNFGPWLQIVLIALRMVIGLGSAVCYFIYTSLIIDYTEEVVSGHFKHEVILELL